MKRHDKQETPCPWKRLPSFKDTFQRLLIDNAKEYIKLVEQGLCIQILGIFSVHGAVLYLSYHEVITMLIQVMYPGNNFDYVKEFMLDNLIESRKIAKFRRSNGWVSVGIDPVRTGKQSGDFSGVERRGSVRAAARSTR